MINNDTLDFGYYDFVRKYHAERRAMKYSISIYIICTSRYR